MPGNHDIVIPEEGHNSADILKWNKDEMLTSELDRMKAFFEYANQNRCFLNNKLIDNKTLNFDGKKIQITLLNSAPFSTLKVDDKELHHFPQDMEKMLLRQDDSDYKITIIHHSFEWFDWESKAMLKKQMQYDDLVFWGHDHTPEQITMKIGNSAEIDYLVGGEFSLHNNNCSFNAVIINTDDDTIECHTFEWNDNQTLFIPGYKKVISKKVFAMCPSNDYLSKLLVGNKQISNRLTDYYVFPDLIARGDLFNDEDRTEKITEDTIFSKIVTDKIIRITGENHSGKTSLLKYLYSIAVSKGFIPLFLESSSHIESDYNRMLKRLFESQYGDTICFDRYQQEEHSNEIIFIDDLDRISSEKAKNNLINNIRESGRLIIYVSSIDESEFEKSIQDQLDAKTIGTLEIRPFYKEMRDELINKICYIKEATDDIKQITITALDYMVQCQPYLFTLSPGNLIPYIIYILQDKAESHTHNTISMVFETNIRNQLLEYIHDSEMVGYISLLSFIASYMYFESHCDTLSIAEYQLQVEKFNTKRKHHMNAKSFFEACKNAGIFIEEHESFNLKFCDNNILAYFVANSMKRELDNDVTNTEHLQFVVKNICFGINDLIIIFLSYLTKNSNLILQMAVRSFEFLDVL